MVVSTRTGTGRGSAIMPISASSTFESRMAPRQVLDDIETLRKRAAHGVKSTEQIFTEAFAGRRIEDLRRPMETSISVLSRVLREAVEKDQ